MSGVLVEKPEGLVKGYLWNVSLRTYPRHMVACTEAWARGFTGIAGRGWWSR